MKSPIRVVSLFCGIGGADLGLYAAARDLGIEVKVVDAIDSWEPAVRIYNKNLPHPVARVADVKTLTVKDLPPHDLVIGGPPCQDHSYAGLRKCQCHLGGYVAPRCCLADFLRLAGDTPYLMENVAPRLISAPFSVKLNAFDFGDVTTRKRWFYSNHLLNVIPTPGPRRFGDIRDHEADQIALEKRGQAPADRKKGDTRGGRSDTGEKVATYADADAVSSLTAHAWHGHDVRSNVKMVGIPNDAALGALRGDDYHRSVQSIGKAKRGDANFVTLEDGALGSRTQSSFHGHKNNGNGDPTRASMVTVGQRSYPQAYSEILEDGTLGSVTSHTHDQPLRAGQSRPTTDDEPLGTLTSGKGGSTGFLKVGLRGHSASASASAFEDDEPIGSLIANSWHGNELNKLGPMVRCPSLLEMARVHSIPDSFDWCGATKTARGKMIANSWPVCMATGVLRAMLVAMGACA